MAETLAESDEETGHAPFPSEAESTEEEASAMERSFTSNNYTTDAFDENDPYLTSDLTDNSSSPLNHGSNLSTKTAVHHLIYFVVHANIDKQKTVRLLRLITRFLPSPNNHPTFWRKLMKLLGKSTKSITDFICGQCNQK